MCSLMIDNSNEHDKTQKNTIYGGGQHQVSLNDEIVYKYLHHCTDTTMSNISKKSILTL